MKSFICKLFLIMLISSIKLLAQTLDPYKFFPSSVGNVWEYSYSSGIFSRIIVSDSILQDGSKLIYFNTLIDPAFRIDTSFNCYYDPFYLNWQYYKLNSDSGDVWIVDSLNPGAGTIYRLALCRNQYEGFFFNYPTTFKEITFYQYQVDTTLNEFSRPDYTITLAYGIGEVMEFDEKGGGPQRILQGCIIDGDTIGIITNVEDNYLRVNSFELFQNFPNPFNNSTTIKFSLSEAQRVKLTIYSLLGEEIKVLVDGYKTSGVHSVVFNADNLPSGVYIYTIVAGNRTSSKKLIILK